MPERDGYIPGVPCWVDSQVPEPSAVLPFYSGLFGWEFDNAMPPDSGGAYFIATLRDAPVAAVGALPDGALPLARWNTYVAVASADESAGKVRDAGGDLLMEPFDVMDAGRMAMAADPEGAVFAVWEARRHFGAQVVNEHGALNFNSLSTRDPERAEEFYGAVFGWRILPLSSGPMWSLPGYGDHLEEKTPGLREGMAQMGAPEGFVDVVAQLAPIAPDDSGTLSHWNVTFGVDDASAVAEQATELGGKVLAGPFDAPWTRVTVIEDPQGAMFVAAQFVAENADLVP
jgi:predicted enzyme related to lactoylglutathione lyase